MNPVYPTRLLHRDLNSHGFMGIELLPAVPIVCPREVDGSPIGIVVIDSLDLALAFPSRQFIFASVEWKGSGRGFLNQSGLPYWLAIVIGRIAS